MSLKKKFDAKKKACNVTFTLTEGIANSSHRVNLAGDFNDWDIENIPMKKLKGGEFSVSVNLKTAKRVVFAGFLKRMLADLSHTT